VQLLSSSHLPHLAAAPSFARAGDYEVLADPFRARLRVVHAEPGDAELSTRLTLSRAGAPVLVHWEVACDARFRDIERYGLFFAHAHLDYQVRVALTGLSPGRGYWARLWTGGAWSPTVRVHTESYAVRVALARSKRDLGRAVEEEPHARLPRHVHPVLRGALRLRSATPRSVAARPMSTRRADL
jgi:hypothetical protein